MFIWSILKGPSTYSPKEKRKKLQPATAAKDSDDPSTLNHELSKAFKRIAELETRIHDLTLHSTTMVHCYKNHTISRFI